MPRYYREDQFNMNLPQDAMKAILRMYEAAYRRGVQQGVHFAQHDGLNGAHAYDFRYGFKHDIAPCLPESVTVKGMRKKAVWSILSHFVANTRTDDEDRVASYFTQHLAGPYAEPRGSQICLEDSSDPRCAFADDYVGMFGHTFTPEGDIQYQFRVLAHDGALMLRIQYFEALLGLPNDIVEISYFDLLKKRVCFYPTMRSWLDAFEVHRRETDARDYALREQQKREKEQNHDNA